MTGEEAKKLTVEGHWVRRRSWTIWPNQVVIHAVWLEIQFEIKFDYQEGKPQFERIALVEINSDPGEMPSGYAERTPPMSEDEWDADDWEIFDYSKLPS
jgi:hypothetical protein